MPKEDKVYKLLIDKNKCEIKEANDLKGMENYATVERLKDEYGLDKGYISIGQAGEMKLASASVAFTDRELRPARHAGRGGLGAVMGSKGLKAIVVDPAGGEAAPIADKEAFKAAAKRFAKALKEHPGLSPQSLPSIACWPMRAPIHDEMTRPTLTLWFSSLVEGVNLFLDTLLRQPLYYRLRICYHKLRRKK